MTRIARFKSLLRNLNRQAAGGSGRGETSASGSTSLRAHHGAGFALESRILLDAAAVETLEQAAEALESADPAEHGGDQQQAEQLARSLDSRQVAGGSGDQLVVIDEAVEGWRDIVDQLGDNVHVEVISRDADGVAQLADIAARYDNLEGLHLISHGEDGQIRLGNTALGQDDLALYQDALATTGDALAPGGDFYIYGCNLAASSEGEALVDALGRITGADVAASDDLTGAGGDWDLEYAAGAVDSEGALSLVYNGSLAWQDTGYEGGTSSGDGYGQNVAAEGPWLVSGNDNDTVVLYKINGEQRTPERVFNSSMDGLSTGEKRVDIDGDYMIIGDRGNNRALLYEWNGSDWLHEQTFTGTQGYVYGWDVGVQDFGDGRVKVAVSSLDSGSGNGAAYAYRSTDYGNSFTNIGGPQVTSGNFGFSIAQVGDYMLVGRPDAGNGYVYQYTVDAGLTYNGNWTNLYDGSSQTGGGSLSSGDYRFGYSVGGDYDGTNAYWAAGGPDQYNHNYGWWESTDNRYGYVAVFQNASHTSTLGGSDFVGGDDKFGHSVDMVATGGGQADVIVGAPLGYGGDGWVFRVNNVIGTGNVTAEDGVWGPRPDATANENMGTSVAVTDYTMHFGAPYSDQVASGAGMIWNLFDYTGGPTAGADSYSTDQNTAFLGDMLANDSVSGGLAFNPVTVTLAPDGRGGDIVLNDVQYQLDGNRPQISFDPNGDFDYLGAGEDLINNASDGGGPIDITYFITDSFGNSANATASVNVTGVNDAPTVDEGISNKVHNAGQTEVEEIPATAYADIDQNDTLTYSLTGITRLDSGTSDTLTLSDFTVDNSANPPTITYSPQLVHEGHRYRLTLEAADGNGGTVTTDFDISIERPNEAPTKDATSVSLNIWQDEKTPSGETSDFAYDMAQHFDDPDLHKSDSKYDSEELQYSVASNTSWASVDALSGTLRGNPLNSDVGADADGDGTYQVDIKATDEYGESVTKTIDVRVYNVNDAPIVTDGAEDQVAYLGQSYQHVLPTNMFSDPDNNSSFNDPLDNVTLSASYADGTALGTAGYPGSDWLQFSQNVDGNGNEGFTDDGGGVRNDSLGTTIDLRVTATDDGTTETTSGTISDPKSRSYFFSIDVFPSSKQTAGLHYGAAGGDQRGQDVAVSANGNWMVAGEPGKNDETGRVSIFQWDSANSVWNQHSTLTAGAPAVDDRYGYSVDINDTGDQILVGAPGESNEAGRAYMLTRSSGTWSETASFTSGDANVGDRFGASVSLNDTGNLAVVGAYGDDQAAQNAGAAYSFSWDGASATQLNALRGATSNARFGYDVAADGNVAVIGSPWDSSVGKSFAGSATIAGLDGGGFGATRVVDRGMNAESGDYFGRAVDLDVFQGSGTSNADSSVVVAVGAPAADTLASDGGMMFTYRSDGMSTAVTQTELDGITRNAAKSAYDVEEGDWFGSSLSVDAAGDDEANGLRMMVGSDWQGGDIGAAYAYRWWDSSGWLGQRYNPEFLTADRYWGHSVDLGGQRFAVGAPHYYNDNTGAVATDSTADSLVESAPNTGATSKVLGSEVSPAIGGGSSVGVDPLPLSGRGLLDERENEYGFSLVSSLLGDVDTTEEPSVSDLEPLRVERGFLFEERTGEDLADLALAEDEEGEASQSEHDRQKTGSGEAEQQEASEGKDAESPRDNSEADKGETRPDEAAAAGFSDQLRRASLVLDEPARKTLDALQSLNRAG